mgnify:FL=1
MTAREQTTLRLPAELMERLRQQAQEMGISVNTLILTILNAEKIHREKLGHFHFQSALYALK